MRRPGEIHRQFQQALFRHRKKAIEAALKRTPENCAHNRVSPLHPAVDPDGTPFQVRVCGNAQAGLCGVVCDLDHGGDVVVHQCDQFVPLRTPEEVKATVKEEFRQLARQPPATLASKYPDLAALAWVLEEPVEMSEDVEDVPQELHDTTRPAVPPTPQGVVALVPVERWPRFWGWVRTLGRYVLWWR